MEYILMFGHLLSAKETKKDTSWHTDEHIIFYYHRFGLVPILSSLAGRDFAVSLEHVVLYVELVW